MKDKFECVDYRVGCVLVNLSLTPVSCRAKVIINSSDYTIKDIGTVKVFEYNNNSVSISINDLNTYNSLLKNDRLNILTKWKSFDVKWHKKDFRDLDNTITLFAKVPNVDLELIVSKYKYVPSEWYGSYENYRKRYIEDNCYLVRNGYVNNRTKAEFTINNVHKPFAGGSMIHK